MKTTMKKQREIDMTHCQAKQKRYKRHGRLSCPGQIENGARKTSHTVCRFTGNRPKDDNSQDTGRD